MAIRKAQLLAPSERSASASRPLTSRFTRQSSQHCILTHALPPCRRKFGEEEVGFRYVASGPLVRSSYRAGEFFVEVSAAADTAVCVFCPACSLVRNPRRAARTRCA